MYNNDIILAQYYKHCTMRKNYKNPYSCENQKQLLHVLSEKLYANISPQYETII
jgi:hypothetical protein